MTKPLTVGAAQQLPPSDRLPAWVIVLVYLGLLLLLPARLVLPGLGGEGRPAVLLGLGLLLWWGLTRLIPGLAPGGSQPVRWILVALVVTTLWSYALAFDRGLLPLEARSADRGLLRLGSHLGVALVLADGLRNRVELDKVLGVLTGFAGFTAAVGVLQFYGLDLAPYLRVPGLVYNSELVGLGLRGGPGFSRVYGTQQHSIEFGVILAMILPIAVHRALFARSRSSSQRRWGLVALIASAIPFAISRAGFLGLLAGFIVLSVVWPRRLRLRAYLLAAAGLVVFRGVVPGVLGTIRSAFLNYENDPSIINRRADYAASASYVADRPWFGRGPSTFVPEQYRVLDNQLLLSLLEVGVAGTTAVLAVFLGAYALGRSVRRHAVLQDDAHLGQALAASAAVALVASFTFDSLGFPTFAGITFSLLGLSGALWRISRGEVAAQSGSSAHRTQPAWDLLQASGMGRREAIAGPSFTRGRSRSGP